MITNQEAIEILKIERDHMTPTLLTERTEAMDMAISALQEQEIKHSTESSSTHKALDTISRQAAINAFNTDIDELIVGGKGNAEAVEKYLNGVIGRIKELPSAQPEHLDCGDCIDSGGDYECDHVHCHKGKSGE